ncbi:hypothetical protein BDF22DRAFT_673277 [Syncephalis plumigaleata]|nr:hypothetical protein BDF22DRAFT_673277 [Syncephalis plumigaleata]
MSSTTASVVKPTISYGQQLLLRYVVALNTHPLRTKAITAGVLNGLQELIAQLVASRVARTRHSATNTAASSETARPKPSAFPVDKRVVNMALYGFLISGPLNHALYDILNRIIAGRKDIRYAIAQLLAANLIISPILNTVYLSAMEVIAGRPQIHHIRGAVTRGLLPMLRISWMLFPLVQISAQRYLPPQLWVPYFNLVGFVFGVYFNIVAKMRK